MVRVFIYMLIIGAVVSCKHGPEESTLKAIDQLDTNWLELSQQSLNWGRELKATLKACSSHQCPLDSVSEDNDNVVVCPCIKEQSVLNSLTVESDVFQKEWRESTVSFDAWRNKIKVGNIGDEAANNSLDEFKLIYTTRKEKLQSWIEAYSESKENYLNNCGLRDTTLN